MIRHVFCAWTCCIALSGARLAQEVEPAELPAVRPAKTLTNSLGLKLVLIPAGEFLMGNEESSLELLCAFPTAKLDMLTDAYPQHRVRITRSFYMGAFEVTISQFAAFVDATKYRTDAEGDGKGGWGWVGDDKQPPIDKQPKFTWGAENQCDTSPVVNISFNDAETYCQWLSCQEGKTYRLPTEAEWEYACRAGTTTRFSNGNSLEGLVEVANFADGTAGKRWPRWQTTIAATDGHEFPAPVGSFKPNAFGLYDMHGNAMEWCSDWYDEDYYTRSASGNPRGPVAGAFLVYRGGAWNNEPAYCRSAYRHYGPPSYRNHRTGFRVVCEVN